MKSQYQSTRSKKRLIIYLLKLSTRGEIVKTNLANLIQDFYDETGQIFAKSDFGVVFESFLVVESDEVCNPPDKVIGCGDGFNVNTGLCSSDLHKPIAPILVPSISEQLSEYHNQFPGNLFAVCSILKTIKPVKTIKKNVLVKFRRDFGQDEMRQHWPEKLNFDRYEVKNPSNDNRKYGICDVIK